MKNSILIKASLLLLAIFSINQIVFCEPISDELQDSSFGTIQMWSRGDEVKQLQEKLMELGFNVDYVDGVFGPKTEAGLKEYQKAQGLEETGIIGSRELFAKILTTSDNNILVNADYYSEKDNKSEVVESENFEILDNIDLQSLIGKTVKVSVFVNTPGERGSSTVEMPDYMRDRFGCYAALVWSDSTGILEEMSQYPAAELLSQTVEEKKISSSFPITPPEGYDTLSHVSVTVQSGARPAEGNEAVWALGFPCLEIVE